MKIHLEMKQTELLHDTLGFMAAELEDIKDNAHEIKYCKLTSFSLG